MQWILLLLGCLPYFVMAYVMYDDTRRNSNYCIPIAAVSGVMSATLWAVAARYIDNNHRIYVYDLIWDTMITMIFILVPVIWFGVKFNKTEMIGIVVTGIGLLLLKAGSHLGE